MKNCEMRRFLKTVYNGPKWAAKVDKMPDRQVLAVYLSIQQRQHGPKKPESEDYHQLTLAECGYDI